MHGTQKYTLLHEGDTYKKVLFHFVLIYLYRVVHIFYASNKLKYILLYVELIFSVLFCYPLSFCFLLFSNISCKRSWLVDYSKDPPFKSFPYLLNKQKMLSAGQLTTSSKEAKYIVNADYRSIKLPWNNKVIFWLYKKRDG